MTTVLDYRPEVAAAVADGSLHVGLSEDDLASLQRDLKRIAEILVPLTWAASLADAEKLTAANEAEFSLLVGKIAESLRSAGASAQADELTRKEIGLGEPLLCRADERWQGILQSEAAYTDWFARQAAIAPADDTPHEIARLDEETRRPYSRFIMAKSALNVALTSADDASPAIVSALTELADNCMTEVEDVFLAHADYGDDDGGTVSYEEVRARLGL